MNTQSGFRLMMLTFIGLLLNCNFAIAQERVDSDVVLVDSTVVTNCKVGNDSIVQLTYRAKDGSMISCYVINDDNYAIGQANVEPDKYTGEEKIIPSLKREIQLYQFKRVIDGDSIIYKDNTLSYYGSDGRGFRCLNWGPIKDIYYFLKPDYIGIFHDTFGQSYRNASLKCSNWQGNLGKDTKFEGPLKGMSYSDVIDVAALTGIEKQALYEQVYNPFFSQRQLLINGKWIPVCSIVVINDILSRNTSLISRITGGNEMYAFNPQDSTIYFQNLFEWRIKPFAIHRIPLSTGEVIFLPTRAITGDLANVEENDKIVTIHFVNGDYVKLSTFAKVIMEGKLTDSEGIVFIEKDLISVKANNKKSKKVDVLYGEHNVEIPVSSTYKIHAEEAPDYATLLYWDSKFVLEHAEDIDAPDGTPIFAHGKWVGTDDYNRNIEEKRLAQQRKVKEDRKVLFDKIYSKYCQTYGKKYVDAALEGKLLVGTPESMLKAIYRCRLKSQNSSVRIYYVAVTKAVQDKEGYKISADYADMFAVKKMVTVQNGVVTSIVNL